VCFAGSFGAEPPLHADWIGELRIGERASLVELKIETTGNTPAGAIIYPVTGQKALALTKISSARGRVSFAWPDDNEQMLFEGEVSNGILSGKVQHGSKVGTLHLVSVANFKSKPEDGIFGYYELSPGHLLSITSFPLGPVYVDYTTGRVGVLFPTSKTEFFAGPSFQVPVPIAVRARLTMDAERSVTGIRWKEGNSKEQFGKKVRLRQEEVVFRNGDTTLSGTLTLPNGKGPHPAIVRIHGAGGQTRRNVVDAWYAYHGVAYLAFDKRGVGKSAGDWREAGLSDLADDVLASMRFLRQRPEIDGNQISVEANSEGGWIAPIVATRDPKLRSIILIAGPALNYVSELLNETEENAKARGLGGEDLSKALTFRREALIMLQNGAGLNDQAWDRLQAFVRPYRNEKWFRYVAIPEKTSWAQRKLYLMTQLDTAPLWRTVTIPVLALYGGKDLNVPAARNVTALTEALKSAGNRDYEIKVLPNANHDGLETDKALLTDDQVRYLQGYAPGYFEARLKWVRNRLRRAGIRH
jgi:uncharacterized protein